MFMKLIVRSARQFDDRSGVGPPPPENQRKLNSARTLTLGSVVTREICSHYLPAASVGMPAKACAVSSYTKRFEQSCPESA
jgi:hypothetical protein